MIIPFDWTLTVYIGPDFVQDVQFTENDEPIDLTGYTAYDQIRDAQRQDGALIAEFDCTVVEEEGRVVLALTDQQTAGITAEKGYHTLVLRDPDGIDMPYAMGEVKFEQTATVVPV